MDIPYVKSHLSTRIPEIQYKDAKPAAVLIIIYGRIPKVLMTQKSADLKVHAGEISFPGGKPEKPDTDLLDTALRETREEIGISILREHVIGHLDPVTTRNSGFKIFPFIAVSDNISHLQANSEVESIYKIPLKQLLETMMHDPDPRHNSIQEMLVFTFDNKTIWGASARMLGQMAKRLGVKQFR